MASQEQVKVLLEALKKAPPSQMFQSIDASSAGTRAILLYLDDTEQSVTAGAISDQLHVSTARVAVLLKKMEAKGLLERTRDPKDARKVMVRLLPEGRTLAAQLHQHINERVEAMIDQVGMDRMLEFAAISQEIYAIISPAEIDI